MTWTMGTSDTGPSNEFARISYNAIITVGRCDQVRTLDT